MSILLLVVDDEPNQREMLASILRRSGFDVDLAADGEEARELLAARSFALCLTDQRMPRMDGLALLHHVREQYPRLPVVLMTAHGSVQSAVAAMKEGATDYLEKPFDKDELLLVIQKALRQSRLEEEVEALHGALRDRLALGNIVGNAPRMQEVFSLVERIAHTDVPVLIKGESGTGKELVARAIHLRSPRASGPFVGLNCAAVPESLMESEFFGHERGAFTGAVKSHMGAFERASSGTLFLDEVAAMRVDLQAKLLRALQEREVQRVGGQAPIKVDVRIVAATCENLADAIRQRTFREDLYYRLNVVPIELPSLAERCDDIPLLVEHFLDAAARKFGKPKPGVAPEVMDRLQAYAWPGNVRELENAVERMVLLARGPRLLIEDLPAEIRSPEAPSGADAFSLPAAGVRLAELEEKLIREAMRRSRGAIGPAAKLLGISYKTLQYRLKKHGVGDEEPAE
ncbi:MAG: sigma-54 dependent transcriptional regulator [Acidobacteriota bacterium]